MRKTIVLTDITRMHGGKCCIAGSCQEEENRLYRLSSPYVSYNYVIRNNWHVGSELVGRFDREATGESVHVEDSNWSAIKTNSRLGDAVLRSIFAASCVDSLYNGLGITGRGTPMEEFAPKGRSIVTVRPEALSVSIKEPYGGIGRRSVRVSMNVGGQIYNNLPVTDIRVFTSGVEVDANAVDVVRRHISLCQMGVEEVFLRVGVTRPFAPSPVDRLKYWTQVDGFHFFNKESGQYTVSFDRHIENNIISRVA